jgi:hypothetical protein
VWTSSQLDIIGAHAPRWDAHGPMNSGLIYFRSNRRTEIYLRAVIAHTPVMYWLETDQVRSSPPAAAAVSHRVCILTPV